ncbi:MAG: hypothetical protein NT086_19710 [Proteobacteria bacterium]|nr:hypothetical protein [Pseudomonadota bacterium]
MTKIIIALTGAAGAGKDTVADYLVHRHNFKKMAFADVLRKEVCDAFSLDESVFTNRETKEIETSKLMLIYCKNVEFISFVNKETGSNETSFNYCPRSPRWIMQCWGDFRRAKQPNYFINALKNNLQATDGNIVISDLRFNNEAVAISGKPYRADIWKITNPRHQPRSSHLSEAGIDQYFIDRWLDNSGSIQTLHDLTELFYETVLWGAEAPAPCSEAAV